MPVDSDSKPNCAVRRKRLFFRVVAVTFACLTGIALVEGVVRLRQYIKYGSAQNTLYSTSIDAVSGLSIPTPNQVTRNIRINSRGFRSPELIAPKPASGIRIAFVGASTTFCGEVSSETATWPHLVWRSFQEQWSDTHFDYVNGGVPGYVVATSLRNLKYRIHPLQPDIIVIYHAVNDLSKDTRELAETQGIYRDKVDKPGFIGQWLLTWFLVEKNLQIMRNQHRVRATRHVAFEPRKLASSFHNGLHELVVEATNSASVVAIATFSQRLRAEQSPEEQIHASNTHLYYMPHMTIDGLLRGFDEYNRAIRQVARETGVILVNGEETIPGDSRHFKDSVHFTDLGCELMARRVSKALLASEAVRQLVKQRTSARRTSGTMSSHRLFQTKSRQ